MRLFKGMGYKDGAKVWFEGLSNFSKHISYGKRRERSWHVEAKMSDF